MREISDYMSPKAEVFFIVGTSTCIKWVVQCLNLKLLFDIRSCMLMSEN